MKTKINVTLTPENIEWIDEGVDESKFTSRSAGVDYAILATRRRESPEAIQAAREMEVRLRDAEERARKAEGALETVAETIMKEVETAFMAALKEQVTEITDRVERALEDAYAEASKERQKRFRAEDLGHEYAEGYVARGQKIKELENRIAALEAEKAEASD